MYLYDPNEELEVQLKKGIDLFYAKFGEYPEAGFFHPKYLEEERDYKFARGKTIKLIPSNMELLKSFSLVIGLDKR